MCTLSENRESKGDGVGVCWKERDASSKILTEGKERYLLERERECPPF